MYTMILVEDEKITREGLLSLPLWEKLGIRIVSVQKNAQDGLKAILELKPDIVLTDIYMPGNTGLWMVEQAAKSIRLLHVVIISAYDKVNDLKQAIQLGAVDYILKPVVLSELEACMVKIIARVNLDRNQKKHLSNLESRAAFDLLKLKKEALEHLLVPPQEGFAQLCNSAELCLSGPRLQAMVVSLEGAVHDSFDESCFSGCIASQFEIVRIPDHPKRFALFFAFGSDEADEEISTIAIRIREKINVQMNRTLGIGIGMEVTKLEELHQSYLQAREALKRRLYLGRNQIISYDEPEDLVEPEEDSNIKIDLDTALSQGGTSIKKYVEYIKNTLVGKQLTIEQCHYKLMGKVYKAQELMNLTGEEKEAFCRQTIQLISQSEIIDEMCDILHGFLSEISKTARQSNSDCDVVEHVKAIIDKHFAENISIGDIARMVYLSPTYLCLLFRRREEMTINEYVTLKRIEKAKQLLTLTKMPLNDISNTIGYENPSYFARRFKEQTGKLPSEYRKEMGARKKRER